ncbi:MAG: aminopeptidase P N-terminal domain-containing protein [Wenzhouxiangellaceae bacterium]
MTRTRSRLHQRRRRHLMQLAGPGSVLIVQSAREQLRNGDTHWPFRQDSDFWYLTGFNEPDAVLVMLPDVKGGGRSVLFLRERDPERERWDGPRLGLEGALEQLGMDDAFPIGDLDEIVPGMIENRDHIYYSVGRDPDFDRRVIGWRNRLRQSRRGAHAPEEFIALDHLLHEMRLIKSSEELRLMRHAARISANAHCRAMRVTRPGLNEADLTAELVHEFTRHCAPAAYPPIVAGGANALVLHYIANNQPLPDDGLVLIDAGCEAEGYAADISRTFPVSGRFTPAQRAVYEVVLAAQRAAIDQARPGNAFACMHETACRLLTEGLVELGLLDGDVDHLLQSGAYKRFYMHKTGHWLGLDVHDVGDYQIDGQSRVLEKNMVTTVEPALYIGAEDDIPVEFRNIGIRIEDDIRITDGDPEILTSQVPVQIDEIEALMRS